MLLTASAYTVNSSEEIERHPDIFCPSFGGHKGTPNYYADSCTNRLKQFSCHEKKCPKYVAYHQTRKKKVQKVAA